MAHDLERWHRRTREQGVNHFIYGLVRVSFQLFFWAYFGMRRIGREHIPRRGPVIIASNHRSFLDPFVIACMANRPMYYVAKEELFAFPVLNWLLAALGAFPVRRGASDAEMVTTAKAILKRGGIVLIFPEGTRTRPGALGRPHRGVGRLALETGAPVVPMAVIGTEAIRHGWHIRPHKVRLRAGPALRFPRVDAPSPALAGAVTDRIWPCVMLQWEWLGGLGPFRRVVVIGAGAWGTSLAASFARAGLQVTLESPATQLSLDGVDLVCLAVPAAALAAVLDAHGDQIGERTGVLVAGSGLVAPDGTPPATFVAGRTGARAVAALGRPAGADDVLKQGSPVLVASDDRAFARQVAATLRDAALDVSVTTDLAASSSPDPTRAVRAA